MEDFNDALVAKIPYLRRYAFALTSGRCQADDLVQDTLERALKRQQRFQSGTNLRAWLFTIMHNVFVDQIRRQARRPQPAHIEEERIPCTSLPAASMAVELAELQRAIGQLPAKNREVLLLVGLEGFSYEEAAEMLDVPVGTVKSRLFRARHALASLYPQDGNTHSPCSTDAGPTKRNGRAVDPGVCSVVSTRPPRVGEQDRPSEGALSGAAS